MNEFNMNTKTKAFKKMIKNAYDDNGKLLSIENQIFKMLNKPSSYWYGAVDIGESMNFCNVNSDIILFTKKDLMHIYKHITYREFIEILENIKENILLGNDYYDINSNTIRKNFIIENRNNLYILSLRQENNYKILVNELTTIFCEGDIDCFDTNKYISNVLYFAPENNSDYCNYIYKNKKSNSYLIRFLESTEGVGKSTIANFILTYKNNIISRKDI